MKTLVVLLVPFLNLAMFAQQAGTLPDSPSALVSSSSPSATAPLALRSEASQPASNLVVTPRVQERPARVVDRKFITIFGISAAMTVVDMELTQRCLGAQTCREGNPLFGSNPTRARMYGISLPLLGGQAAISYIVKKRYPQRRLWMIPLISNSAMHGVGSLTAAGK